MAPFIHPPGRTAIVTSPATPAGPGAGVFAVLARAAADRQQSTGAFRREVDSIVVPGGTDYHCDARGIIC